jgi:hypothetical protein
LNGTTILWSRVDDGSYEPHVVNVPTDAFLNSNAGLQGDEGVVDEDGEVVVNPFGGEILDGWI